MKKLISLLITLSISTFLFGCKGPASIIDSAGFKLDPSLKTASVTINFNSSFSPQFGGSYELFNYGTAFANQAEGTTPFQAGFSFNLAVLHADDLVHFERTGNLPNGTAFPALIGKELVKVQLKSPLDPRIDPYVYVDLPANLNGDWVGIALSLNYKDLKNLPNGLAMSQNFIKDKQGRDQVSVAVYGPQLDSNGNVAVPAGIAVFANVRSLVNGSRMNTGITEIIDHKGSKARWTEIESPEQD